MLWLAKRKVDNMQIVSTGDGSHTVSSRFSAEHYHSTHGAVRESIHVFIRHGLDMLGPRIRIRVLEMGFGTGLNALLTQLRARRLTQPVDFVSVDSEPLPRSIIDQLNYGRSVEGATGDMLNRLHDAPWGEVVPLEPFFQLQKLHTRIEEVQLEAPFDVVYYDAFGPAYQPELWTRDAFARMYDVLLPGGTIVTYCAKGQVKRDLRAVGFSVESLPGPPGKREMTRARKDL